MKFGRTRVFSQIVRHSGLLIVVDKLPCPILPLNILIELLRRLIVVTALHCTFRRIALLSLQVLCLFYLLLVFVSFIEFALLESVSLL